MIRLAGISPPNVLSSAAFALANVGCSALLARTVCRQHSHVDLGAPGQFSRAQLGLANCATPNISSWNIGAHYNASF
jgi:hypothetical protein